MSPVKHLHKFFGLKLLSDFVNLHFCYSALSGTTPSKLNTWTAYSILHKDATLDWKIQIELEIRLKYISTVVKN